MDQHRSDQEGGVIETLQSLVVAFVLAMTFRGFVAEGFVIPTGSMAPTLMGQHLLLHSHSTGYTFPVGLDLQLQSGEQIHQRLFNLVDPMVGPNYRGGGWEPEQIRPRMGDRILVLKSLYPFAEPDRFDVVVFKNPTDPMGDSANYIKRLIGLPNETIWLADGDVFAHRVDEETFHVQRKPEHVQRALWQPVHDSRYDVVNPMHLNRPYSGPPWSGVGWDTSGRAFHFDTAEATMLEWRNRERRLDDWTAYNMLGNRQQLVLMPVSDVRVAAGVVADDEGLETSLEVEARRHVFEFALRGGEASVRYRPANEPQGWVAEDRQPIDLPAPGRVFNVEFWHVDQTMAIYLDGRRVAYLEYDWSPMERLEHATGYQGDQALGAAERGLIQDAALRWHFEGSPVTLHRVRVDRDLYYRPASLDVNTPRHGPRLFGPAFGTHPDHLATLGPDQFFMLGDNSQASLDSRLWGQPHELIAHQIDRTPFVVNRKLLLGKAWVVYFPAPHPITAKGVNIVPDFGRLRYIR